MKTLIIILTLLFAQQKPAKFQCPKHPVKVGYIYEKIYFDDTYPLSVEEKVIAELDSQQVIIRVLPSCRPAYTDTVYKEYFLCETPIQLAK